VERGVAAGDRGGEGTTHVAARETWAESLKEKKKKELQTSDLNGRLGPTDWDRKTTRKWNPVYGADKQKK